MLREGKYLATATAVSELEFSKNGIPQIQILFTTDEGQITAWLYFPDDPAKVKAARMSMKSLQALGWKGTNIANVALSDLSEEVEIVVEHEPDLKGEPRARVKWINVPGSGSLVPGTAMSDAQKKVFAEKMKGLCMSVQAAPPVRPAQPAQPTPKREPAQPGPAPMREPGDESDFPF